MVSVDRDVNLGLLSDLVAFVAKVERWWIREVELAITGDYTAEQMEELADSDIQSGRMMFLSVLLQVAMGDETDAAKFYDEFLKAMPSN